MWKSICLVLLLANCCCCKAVPLGSQQKKQMPTRVREEIMQPQQESDSSETDIQSNANNVAEAEAAPVVSSTLTLPSNATSIRADITDSFSCANKSYGYYADVENDCQIFHVCLPVTYADGKENTFRWSFICPEETIFSQESFTCMRREDMMIECEESYKYYELNSNFGQPIEEEKESSSNQQSPAVESEQPTQAKPQSMENEASVPAESAPEPVMEPVKPVKVQKPKPKPNRRKPAVTYNKPPRKSAKPVTSAPIEEAMEQPKPEVESQLVTKPLKPSRFSIRPNKEKPQAIKPAVPAAPSATATPIRNELFNSIRKRPTIFNKNNPAKPAQENEATVTEAAIKVVQAALSEPQPTLNIQTMFTEAPPAVVAAEEPAAEASEAAVVIAQPEAEVEPENVAKVDSVVKPEKNAEAELTELAQEEVKPIEAIEEIPAVIVETLEDNNKKIEQPMEQHQEEPKPVNNEESATTESHNEPSIIEASNTNEETPIEVLEAAKPADAPVSLPATPEMEHPSPLVEQMLEDSSANNEAQVSLGGFKPVDPVMAAEAEQLITDFLNTLRKHEEKPETELSTGADAQDIAETLEQQPQITENDSKAETDADNEANAVSIEEAKLPEPETVDTNVSVEEQLLEAEPQLKLKPDSPIINIMQLSHLPADYQIPVQVVAASEPLPELTNEAPSHAPAETEPKPVGTVSHDDAQETLATAAYMPSISIDDIVELVKERLDQNPQGDQLKPMELVLTPGATAPLTLVQSSNSEITSEKESKPEEEAPKTDTATAQEEEVIVPIYNRVSAAEPAMSLAQTLPVTANKVETESKPTQNQVTVPEVREPKFTTRMDARKRRFLFRADAS